MPSKPSRKKKDRNLEQVMAGLDTSLSENYEWKVDPVSQDTEYIIKFENEKDALKEVNVSHLYERLQNMTKPFVEQLSMPSPLLEDEKGLSEEQEICEAQYIASQEVDHEDVGVIRNSLVIERVPEYMSITVVAIDLETPTNNSVNLIRCEGDAIGCYVYNVAEDGYYYNCKVYSGLGSIAVAYRIFNQGDAETNNIIALPDRIVEKYLSPAQRKTLKAFREKYQAPRYEVRFIQSVIC